MARAFTAFAAHGRQHLSLEPKTIRHTNVTKTNTKTKNMKHRHSKKDRAFTALAAAATLLAASPAQAFTFVSGDPATGGIGYAGQVTIGSNDSGTYSDHTGAWSWEDQGIAPGGGEGWTHTSRWIALTVLSDTVLSVNMDRNSAVPYLGSGNVGGFAAVDHMFPSFTIWQGWDNDLMLPSVATLLGYDPGTAHDHHTYLNTGNPAWAEDLTYIGHYGNATLTSITSSWNLTAGQYTMVFGSNSPSTDNPPRQGFSATFATPEPGRSVLLALGGMWMILRRRRRA